MDQNIDYLHKAISDTQAIIRAIDVKCGFLFVILFTPVASLDRIYPTWERVFDEHWIFSALVSIIIIGWIIAFIGLFRTVASTSGPSNRIFGDVRLNSFYGSDLFAFHIADIFFSTNNTSKRTLDQEIQNLPPDDASRIKELTYEKMKLAYIQELKIRRVNFCLRLTCAWIIVIILTYVAYIVVKHHA